MIKRIDTYIYAKRGLDFIAISFERMKHVNNIDIEINTTNYYDFPNIG